MVRSMYTNDMKVIVKAVTALMHNTTFVALGEKYTVIEICASCEKGYVLIIVREVKE